ncbi:MAG: DUF4142 domain-containing protein [Sphingomonadales bacterium]|nr:DUF4142 domain-containing protein [Sphingomonadales bacterium]
MRQTLLAAASLLFGLALPGVPAIAAPDTAFLQDAVAGDNGEVALGRLAQQRSHDPRVRRFGALLVKDHGMAKQQVLATARRSHVRIDAAMMKPDADQARRALMGARGREFDRMFAQHMVEDHRTDIAKFEQQAKGGDPVTARLAQATLPHLRHHLEVAESLPH